jgi:uncharacterized protein (PEP-CTERM system associated)
MQCGDDTRAKRAGNGSLALLLSIAALPMWTVLAAPATADVQITPSAGLRVIATDNLRRQPTNEEGDVALEAVAGVSASASTLRLKFLGSASLMYDAFAENSDLNRLTGNALANVQVAVVPEFLYVDGSVQVSDEFLDVLDQSGSGLPTGAPQNRVTNVQAGAYVTTKVADVADLKLRGSMAAVQTEALDGSGSTLGDAVSYSASVLLTNGDRSRNAVWRLSGSTTHEERENDEEFNSSDAAGSVALRVTPRIQAVVRGGYEDISGTNIDDIEGTIWGAGLIYRIGDRSQFNAEWGQRFGRQSWSGELDLQLSDRMVMGASYNERIESQQGRLNRQLNELFDLANSLPTPALPSTGTPGQSFVDGIFYTKDATIDIGYAGLSQNFTIAGRYSERDSLQTTLNDRTAGITAAYSEVLLKDLVLGVTGSYEAALDSAVGFADGRRYVGSGILTYQIGPNAAASLQYTWSRTSAVDDITENVATAGIRHTF